MTTKPTSHESKMLEEVRRWRKEAFEADQARSPEERVSHLAELLRRFGLPSDGANRVAPRRRPGR
jgi:uncharacterized protein (DUF2336 family)